MSAAEEEVLRKFWDERCTASTDPVDASVHNLSPSNMTKSKSPPRKINKKSDSSSFDALWRERVRNACSLLQQRVKSLASSGGPPGPPPGGGMERMLVLGRSKLKCKRKNVLPENSREDDRDNIKCPSCEAADWREIENLEAEQGETTGTSSSIAPPAGAEKRPTLLWPEFRGCGRCGFLGSVCQKTGALLLGPGVEVERLGRDQMVREQLVSSL